MSKSLPYWVHRHYDHAGYPSFFFFFEILSHLSLNYIWMIIKLSVYACRVGGNSWILCLVSLQHIEDHSRSLAWNNSYQGAWLVTLRSEVSFLYSSNRCQVLLFFLNFNESHELCIDHYEITLVNKLLNVSETCNCKQLLKWFLIEF